MIAVYAYGVFTCIGKISWSKPRYMQPESLFYVPNEIELDALIASANSKRMTTSSNASKKTTQIQQKSSRSDGKTSQATS